jgi:hypothetical protein
MKQKTVILALVVILVLFCGIQTARADIGSVNFMGAYYRGTDPFYGTGSDIVAYKAGSNVTVAVSVYNPYYSMAINISSIKIWFDWGANYTSSEVSKTSPFALPLYQSHVFTIKLTLPSDVSTQVTRSYKVYAEYSYPNASINSLSTWTYQNSNFVVYSNDQADAQNLYLQLITTGLIQQGTSYYYYYYPTILNFPYIPFVSSQARMLWGQARNKATGGYVSYARGDFSEAKASYQTALNLVNQSFDIESKIGAGYENSFMNFTNGAASAMNGIGSATLILAWGIGIGAILFGLGILVYGIARLRTGRPRPPAQQS